MSKVHSGFETGCAAFIRFFIAKNAGFCAKILRISGGRIWSH